MQWRDGNSTQRGFKLIAAFVAMLGCIAIAAMIRSAVRAEPATERSANAAFNPLPLDDSWTRWFVGQWTGEGESDAGSGRGMMRVELGLNGQFLIVFGEAEVSEISAEQRQYLKTQLHATDGEIARFRSLPFRSLEIYTLDQETGEVVGYLFDSLRCMATGRGRQEGDSQIVNWKWASGHTSQRVTTKVSEDRLTAVEKVAMPDGSTMEESGDMVRRQ
jgi:hypothetical protein